MISRIMQRMRVFWGASSVEKSAPPPVPMGSTTEDRLATAVIIGIYFTMVAFLGCALYVTFAHVVPTVFITKTSAACHGDRENECGEGKMCRNGSCVEEPVMLDCAEGSACDGCTCIIPMKCGEDNFCRAPSVPETQCSDEVIRFVGEMVEFQEKCIANAGGEPLSSCPTDNVMNFLLSHEAFDSLLKSFPNRLMFLFPLSAPPLQMKQSSLDGEEASRLPWPDKDTKKFYIDAIQKQAKEFTGARYIVLVGRASRGNPNKDFAYAQARVRFARDILIEALANTPVARGAISKNLIEFSLGSARPLQLGFFQLYRSPAITWSKQSEQDLSKAIEMLDKNHLLKKAEKDELENTVNRSVAIFAIPPECVRTP